MVFLVGKEGYLLSFVFPWDFTLKLTSFSLPLTILKPTDVVDLFTIGI